MVETIDAVCPTCKTILAVPGEYEHKKVKCKCGQVFIAAKKLTEPKEPVSIGSARGKPSHNKSVIALGVIAISLILILSVFLKQRLANKRGTVKGGAWLTSKLGTSEPIRGLNIEVLNPQNEDDHWLAIRRAELELRMLALESSTSLTTSYERSRESALQEEIRTLSRDDYSSVDMLDIQSYYALIVEWAKSSKQVMDLKYEMGRVSRDKWIAFNEAYMNIGITWESICLEQAIRSVHTDVDGKYRIELPVGSYYLYGAFESEYSSVDWFIPLQVLSNEETEIDFHNENASRIDNKLE